MPPMPPKPLKATAKKGLSQSIHNPRSGDSLQLRPTHFIIREGSPGSIVPVIPVDLLPDYVTVLGLSRKLTIGETAGMSNLGTFTKPKGHFQLQFVSHAHDRPTGGGLESPDPYCPREPQRLRLDIAKDHETGQQSSVIKRSSSAASTSAASQPTPRTLAEIPLPAPSRALDWAEDTSLVSTDDFSAADSSAPASSKSSSGSRDKQRIVQRAPPTVIKEKSDAEIAERMLQLGRVQHAVRHNHPDEALKTVPIAGAQKPVPRSTGKQKLVRPDGSLCRHWCQTGQCSWGTECRYTHQMPVTLEGLADVGLVELPAWWRKKAGLPAKGTIDARIFAAAGRQKSPSPALGVTTASSPVALRPSKKTRLRAGKYERKLAEELRVVRLGIERAQATTSSPVIAVGSKKRLSSGWLQTQTTGVMRQNDTGVEKLVDI
ncbi:hypothetical protein CORC01_14017 [Colletotrichum orchidophilum]|uniref:C3H1-type domain-containing protein n=1 Tax=Colletotrichum orchidophilum TaxID=1209926 RepID=A0A1G4ANB7_9PEZI|nr:uncharacterized protein CORC01_14017 [Colletotrichum orchidophilum]OHE90688.1 hypothetical protein CORC01_14017 [Colletotrichum orchidophilum]